MTDPTRTPARATNLAELQATMQAMHTADSRARGLAFRPRPTDTIIASYAKCGTTWLQQIAHGLRSRGSMEFDDISAVTPWIETAHDLGWDLDAPHEAEPRVFKSHVAWPDVPKGGRYICSFRHPRDAFVSFYRFFEGFYFEPGTIDLDTLFRWRWPRDRLGVAGYWHHLGSWWEQRHNPNVLLLCYEDMQEDLPGTVERVAAFLGIELDDELHDLVVHQSSRSFMLAHQQRFAEVPMRRRAAELGILPYDVDAAKVTRGARDDPRYRVGPDLERELDEIWAEHVTPRFGLDSYEDLRSELRALHGAAA